MSTIFIYFSKTQKHDILQQTTGETQKMFDYQNLTEHEITKIKAYLLTKIDQVKVEPEDTMSEEISNNLEEIFNVTDELLSLSTKESVSVIETLLKELLEKQDILAFDLLNNTVIELMSSGYMEKNGEELSYTLLFFPVITTEMNNNFDNIQKVIKTACVRSGMTESEDDIIPMDQTLPHNFQEKLGIKDCYDYTSKFFNEETPFFENLPAPLKQSNSMTNSGLLYYVPVFVKGFFQDVLSYIAEKNDEITESINETSDIIIKEKNTEIFSPILWSEATQELLETIFINGTSYAQIMSFCEYVNNTDSDDKEVAIIKIKGNEQIVLLLLLDQKDYLVAHAKLAVGIESFTEDALLPIMQCVILRNISMSIPTGRITLKSAMDLFENKEVEEETKDELVEIFNNNEPEDDLKRLYQIYSGSTMSIQ